MKTSLIDMFARLFVPSTLTMDHSLNTTEHRFYVPLTGRTRIPGRPNKPGAKLARRAATHTLTHRS